MFSVPVHNHQATGEAFQFVEAEKKCLATINKEFAALPGDKHYVLGTTASRAHVMVAITSGGMSSRRTELRDCEARLNLEFEVCGRDLAVRAFELSQSLAEKWVAADHAEKRQ